MSLVANTFHTRLRILPYRFVGCLGLALASQANALQISSPRVLTIASQQVSVTVDDVQRMITHGQLTEAEAALNVLLIRQPLPAGAERMRGMIFYQRNQFPSADTAFQKAIAQNPDDLEAVQMRGVTLYRMGQAAAAIPLLERTNSTITSANADGTYVLAVCYLEVHRYEDARLIFAKQYKLPPDSAASYLFMGRMLLRRNYPAESEQMARKALELQPGLPQAHLLLGQLALSRSNAIEAVKEFEEEKRLNPMDGEVYERLGDSYMRASRYEDAQQALNCALLLEPNTTGPYILLGQVLLKREDPLTALSYLLRAERMDPNNHLTHLTLAQAYRTLGRKEDATREYKSAEIIQNSTESPK